MLKLLRMRLSYRDFLNFMQCLVDKRYFTYRFHLELLSYIYLASAIISSIKFLVDSKNSLVDFSETLEMLPSFIGILIRSTYFLLNRNKFHELIGRVREIAEMDNWIDESQGNKLQKRISRIQNYLKIIMVLFGLGLTMNTISAFTSHELPFKMWLPFDYKLNAILFGMSAIYQLFLCVILVPVEVFTDGFPIVLICYATGMVEELSVAILSIDEVKTSSQHDKNSKKLVTYIRVYKELKELTSEITGKFGKIIWIQGFMCTLVLCMSVFSIAHVS